jgi:hypothetical protein
VTLNLEEPQSAQPARKPDLKERPMNLRHTLAAEYRRLAVDLSDNAGHPESHYVKQASDLDAGRPVVVRGWELPQNFAGRFSGPSAYVLVEPDGQLSEVEGRKVRI